jgi:tetratricopeptide (TPR) repeat protein
VLGGVAVMALLGVGFVAFLMSLIKGSEPYRMTEALIVQSEAIRAVVGPDLRLGYWVGGSVETENDRGSAQLLVSVRGAEGSTKVHAVLDRERGQWAIKRAKYVDRTGQARSLLAANVEAAAATVAAPAQQSGGFREHLEAANEVFRRNDFAAALLEYDKAVELDPAQPDAYYWRGAATARMGQTDRALADLNECIRLDPRRLEAYQYVDSILSARGGWDQIIASWTRLIDLEPENAKAYVERGGAYFHKGDRASAMRDAEKSCTLGNPEGCRVFAKYSPAGR